jgi:hypothetical protein
MDRHEQAVGTALVVLALGGTAMTQVAPTLFPGHEALIFWIGVGAVILAVIGLAVLFFRPRKKPGSSSGSRTAHATGGGQIDIEDAYSAADTFAHAEKGSSVIAKRIVHDPARRGHKPRARSTDTRDDPKLPRD